MTTERILVVEDDAIARLDIHAALERAGYEVAGMAASGEEAISLADSLIPDLVLMDIQLEGEMDGVEAANEIVRRFDLPIIFLTVYADDETLRWAKVSGPFGYLLKPVDHKELKSAIEVGLYKHQMDRELKKAKRAAEAASRAKTAFLATISHELRTPMNGIIGLTQLLKETDLDEIQYDYADKVSKSADSLLLLINDILDISKIEAGKLDIDPHMFNLHEMLYESLNVLELQAIRKKVSLELRIDPAISNNLIGDALRIRQIILNFLTNAVKFTDSGGYVFLNVNLQELEPLSTQLLFSVEDTGIGIPQDKLSHVFGKFNQVSKSTTRQFGGTGLGLAISKELAELMGGKVGVESTEGSGSTFWLELDLATDYSSLDSSDDGPALLKNKQCFILGGQPISHEVLEELLQSWHMKTRFYKDTHELREQAISGISPDFIILCNINESQILNDFSTFCKSTPDLIHTKLIFISNHLDQERITQLKRWQIDAYLTNPYLPNDLKQLLLAVSETTDTPNSDIISVFGLKQKLKNNKKDDGRSAAKSKYILLAEDNIINQKVAKVMLLKLGCQVDIAEDGQQAVNMAKQTHYDLIFMDCNMPVLDGYKASIKIRHDQQATFYHCPIIALTANTADEVKAQTDAAGMDDLLTKPISLDKFKQCLNKW